jgi:hypothetical protein
MNTELGSVVFGFAVVTGVRDLKAHAFIAHTVVEIVSVLNKLQPLVTRAFKV